jgi:hypothetical protein
MEHEVDINVLFNGSNPLAAADALMHLASQMPVASPRRKSGESNQDYEARQVSVHMAELIKSTATIASIGRTATIRAIRNFIKTGYWASWQPDEIRSEGEAFDEILDYSGMSNDMSQYTRTQLKSFVVRVCPALEAHGFEISDAVLVNVTNESGAFSIPQTAKNSIALLSRSGGSYTPEQAKMVYRALTLDNGENRVAIEAVRDAANALDRVKTNAGVSTSTPLGQVPVLGTFHKTRLKDGSVTWTLTAMPSDEASIDRALSSKFEVQ